MERLKKGYEFIKHARGKAEEWRRNLVPLRAGSFEDFGDLMEKEHVQSIQVRSRVQTDFGITGVVPWGAVPVMVSSPPDAYVPKTRYEATGLGRRIVMYEEHLDNLDVKAQEDLETVELRCGLTAEHRRELLARKLPTVNVSVDRVIKNEEIYKRMILNALVLGLAPYELTQESKAFFGEIVFPS